MAEKKLTNKQVVDGLEAIGVLQKAKAAGLLKLKLARIAAALRAEYERIMQEVQEIQDRVAPKDEQGKRPPVSPRLIDDANDEIKAILKGDVGITMPDLAESEIEGLEFEGSIEGILPLLTTP